MKPQKKSKNLRWWQGCLVTLAVLLVVLVIAGGIGWSYIAREHAEARSLPLNAVDFKRLKDGKYHGAYAGGMYAWRKNECDVTVTESKVSEIVSTVPQAPQDKTYEELFSRVIAAQSLQVDTVSMATLTSKGYLQCVENALIPAQQ